MFAVGGVVLLALICFMSANGVRADEMPNDHADDALDSEQLELGRRVFHHKCVKCHGSGREGAPVVGRPGAWAKRLEQPVEVLVQHALDGYEGRHRRMPPKGGFPALSDAEVTAAVHYIVFRGRWLANQIEGQRVACIKDQTTRECIPISANDRSLLRFLLLLQGTREAQ